VAETERSDDHQETSTKDTKNEPVKSPAGWSKVLPTVS